ncbi:MAG: C-GCAxxG-C-C family protein [Oscillospiraceae bacterium]|nr:C-GCAxxG-C-C family protein [Oscillospiraceae bacterium]
MDEKLKAAGERYQSGYNCAQAVFCTFAEDLGLDEETGFRMMEGFGGGFGGMQEVCGAFSAATAVIGYHISSGSTQTRTKADTYRAVRQAAEIFKKEYGSIRCKEILHGSSPKSLQCGMKVKDAVLVVQKVLAEQSARKERAQEAE